MSEKKSPKVEVIRFSATVHQIKTLIDEGMNVTLALSDKDIKQISQLLECKKNGAVLEVAIVPVIMKLEEKKINESAKRRTERYPYRSK